MSSNVGRDKLAAMLGASRASDLLATAASASGGSIPPLATVGLGGGRSRGPQRRGVVAKEDNSNDVSRMDRAQAAALVARQFNNNTTSTSSSSSSTAGVGIMRHRAGVGNDRNNNNRKRNYQLLVEENLMNSSSTSQMIEEGKGAATRSINDDGATAHREAYGSGVDNYLHNDRSNEDDTEEEEEVGGQSFSNTRTIRKKVEARVIVKNAAIIGDGKDQRRRRNSSLSNSSSSESDSSHGSSSSSSSSKSYGKQQRRRRRRRTNRRSDEYNSSSSSEEDEADIRRRRVRERAARENEQSELGMGVDVPNDVQKSVMKETTVDTLSDININSDRENRRKESVDDDMRQGSMTESPKHVRRDSTSSTSDDSSTSMSSSSSSSFSSSSDESDHIIDTKLTSTARPVFVPKSQRGTVTDIDIQQKKLDEIEERKRTEAQKRTIKSRALVAEMTSDAARKAENDYNNDGGDEFDTGETGGVYEIVPDDTDPTDENGTDAVMAERDAWEVRELLRILRDIDHIAEQEKERRELERRRALTDDERLAEDRLSGRYRTPGETRRSNNNKEDGKNSYLQRFHHRGAFYMDEDTLNNAGKDDVRHKAAEYARAATGTDKIDKSALPAVMQTKYFGLSGHSTKYQGLAKEDTTDKKMDFLPIRRRR